MIKHRAREATVKKNFLLFLALFFTLALSAKADEPEIASAKADEPEIVMVKTFFKMMKGEIVSTAKEEALLFDRADEIIKDINKVEGYKGSTIINFLQHEAPYLIPRTEISYSQPFKMFHSSGAPLGYSRVLVTFMNQKKLVTVLLLINGDKIDINGSTIFADNNRTILNCLELKLYHQAGFL